MIHLLYEAFVFFHNFPLLFFPTNSSLFFFEISKRLLFIYHSKTSVFRILFLEALMIKIFQRPLPDKPLIKSEKPYLTVYRTFVKYFPSCSIFNSELYTYKNTYLTILNLKFFQDDLENM